MTGATELGKIKFILGMYDADRYHLLQWLYI